MTALAGAGLVLTLAACGAPAGVGGADAPTTESGPTLKIAMITHSGAGDTFWDIVRSGAEAAAKKDHAALLYSADPDGARQAQLVDQAVDQKVDGIIVTLAKPDALAASVKAAVAAGIPVVSINSGEDAWQPLGVLAHFGQNETVAGEAAGAKLTELGAKKIVCVIHEQGNVGHEARCDGIAKTFTGSMERLYVNGVDMSNVASTITSKLQTTPDIDYVVTLGAPFAMTAIDAIADAGSSAKLATFDLNADAVDAMKAGKIQFIVDQQPYLQGYSALDNLWLYKTNGNMLGGGKTVYTGPQILTQSDAESIAKFAKNGTR
ncbi:sugar ABC transporter substrate-binding protein [Mycetocola tolaasinivorans]|uniref:Sugar ABC transporter substrate-binding protein n=1 Tax=Mycetocola tolaasinivorans TaxID=76635 RepID=A0A3L7A9U1_9MICO|nr:sugar ABC transporter substrate-binding protein [Mycetocola tolaasinivorans]